ELDVFGILGRYYFQGHPGFASGKRNWVTQSLPMVLIPTQMDCGFDLAMQGGLHPIFRAGANSNVGAHPGTSRRVEPPILRSGTGPADLEVGIPNQISVGGVKPPVEVRALSRLDIQTQEKSAIADTRHDCVI